MASAAALAAGDVRAFLGLGGWVVALAVVYWVVGTVTVRFLDSRARGADREPVTVAHRREFPVPVSVPVGFEHAGTRALEQYRAAADSDCDGHCSRVGTVRECGGAVCRDARDLAVDSGAGGAGLRAAPARSRVRPGNGAVTS